MEATFQVVNCLYSLTSKQGISEMVMDNKTEIMFLVHIDPSRALLMADGIQSIVLRGDGLEFVLF